MKQKVINVLERNDLSVKEKYDLIEDLQNEFNKYCAETKKKLIAHYDYCPYCKTYYRKNTWEVEHFYKQEEAYEPTKADEFSLCCSTAAVLKILNVPYLRKTCPVGHIIEVKDENNDLV